MTTRRPINGIMRYKRYCHFPFPYFFDQALCYIIEITPRLGLTKKDTSNTEVSNTADLFSKLNYNIYNTKRCFCYILLFSKIKVKFKGKRFDTVEDIQEV